MAGTYCSPRLAYALPSHLLCSASPDCYRLAYRGDMRRVSIDEAAIALGLSVSSVRRRIRAGTLTVEREATAAGFRYAVILPDEAEPLVASADYAPPSQPPSQPASTDYAAPTQDDQVATLTAERDWLRQRVEELTTLLNREQEAVLRLSSQLTTQRLVNDLVTPTQTPSRASTHANRQPARGFGATWRQALRRLAGLSP